MIIFDNFEHDSNLSIIKRYPLSTQAITGDTLGFLDLHSFSSNTQFIDFGETLQPIPTSIDMVVDLTITPIDVVHSTRSFYWFGVPIYTNLCVFSPVTSTIGSQEFAYWEGSTEPQRVTLHLTLKQVHGHWLVTKKINEDLIFRDKLLIDEISIPDLSKIRSNTSTTNLRNIQIHKFVVAYDQEGVIDPTTFNIRPATGTPIGTNISYTGDSLGESLDKNSFTETEPRAYTDQFWAKIEIGEEGTTNPIKFRGAGNGTVPCFFSIGNSTPQYVEDQQAIPTYFGKGKSTLTVEVARPMVLRFAAGTGAVALSKFTQGYNFQTQASGTPPNYIIYNPETGASVTLPGNNTATITNVIGSEGGIIHIYPTGNYNVLTNSLTLTDTTKRLVEIIDYGTVCRYFRSSNDLGFTNLTKLPNYLPMVINNLSYVLFNNAITSSEDIQYWDTSRVESFSYCFLGKDLDFIPNWDYSSATSLAYLLQEVACDAEQDLTINAPNATSFISLAYRANLPNTSLVINAPKATSLSSAFYNSVVKSVDLNLRDVHSMSSMFYGSVNIESLIFGNTKFLNLTNVTSFARNNPNFNFDLSDWCVPFANTTTDFDSGATSWLPENKPKWGNVSCLRGD